MLIIGNGVSETYESYYDMLYKKTNNKVCINKKKKWLKRTV